MPSNNTILATVCALAMLTAAACGSNDADLTERQAAVAEAGAQVMPFALDETTHIFTNTPTGGRQDVVADNPSDELNIEQIREHLSEEATRFRGGDFSDPEAIHGPEMPGLATLKARFDEIDVEYSEAESGATIVYAADDPDVVTAIHLWFTAQTSDHGAHTEHNP